MGIYIESAYLIGSFLLTVGGIALIVVWINPFGIMRSQTKRLKVLILFHDKHALTSIEYVINGYTKYIDDRFIIIDEYKEISFDKNIIQKVTITKRRV